MQPDMERRTFVAEAFRVEERTDTKAPVLRGYGAVFNSLSGDLGGFREQVLPGAFADTLTSDVRLLINHDGLPLARTASGTLKLSEDARGLLCEAELDPTDPDVAALLPKMKRGDVSQMSFAFSVKPGGQDWAKNDDGIVIRSLKAVRLFDVSVVTFPAYAATEVAVRSMAAWQNQPGPDARPNMTLALADLARALA
jgi:HK97 family phage prohead protease